MVETLCRASASATTLIVSAEASMPGEDAMSTEDTHQVTDWIARETIPILTTSHGMSERQASICLPTKAGGVTWTSSTPNVFCAVKAVVAVMA